MKRTDQTTAPGIIVPAAVIALAALLQSGTVRSAALPVVSEINVIAGSRGVAISFSADAPFSARFSGSGKNAVVHMTGSVYGLSEFSYTEFPAASPVSSITAQEKPDGAIDVTIALRHPVILPVKAVQKKNQWMALLSDQPVDPFTWNTPNTAVPAKKTVTAQPHSQEAPAGNKTGTLRSVRLLQRGVVCELAFEFDTEVASSIRRKGNSVSFTAENIKNMVGSPVLKLPANSVFRKVALAETVSKDIPLLTATVTVDTSLAEPNFNIAFTRGTVLSLFIMERSSQKATLWTSGHGLEWNYRFYDVPSYNVDMESISTRAQRDATQRLSREKTFAVKTPEPAPAGEQEPPPQAPAENTPEPSPVVEAAPPPAPVETTATMIVAAANVNVRSLPSLNGLVKGKLTLGDTVHVVATSSKWYKIHSGTAEGFIYSTLVRSPDMAVAAPTATASETQEERGAPVETPQPPEITPVSTTISEDIYLSARSHPDEGLPDRSADPAVKPKKGVRYTGGGRDPFEPIIPGSVSLSGLPFAENLHLVGVLYDDVDRIALCEDSQNDNRPFALREHDPVEKGKVLKIYRDKAVFLITEFGISRSFTLQLSKVTDEQEARKK